MILFKNAFFVIAFLNVVSLCAMSAPTGKKSQIEWVAMAYDAIKNNHTTALTQAMKNIENEEQKKHLFRKIVREKPRFLLLMEAALKSGLDLESRYDKETLLEFVKRKNNPDQIALIEKYLKQESGEASGDITAEVTLEKFQVISRRRSGKIQRSLQEEILP